LIASVVASIADFTSGNAWIVLSMGTAKPSVIRAAPERDDKLLAELELPPELPQALTAASTSNVAAETWTLFNADIRMTLPFRELWEAGTSRSREDTRDDGTQAISLPSYQITILCRRSQVNRRLRSNRDGISAGRLQRRRRAHRHEGLPVGFATEAGIQLS
jgi:hypothetical protein